MPGCRRCSRVQLGLDSRLRAAQARLPLLNFSVIPFCLELRLLRDRILLGFRDDFLLRVLNLEVEIRERLLVVEPKRKLSPFWKPWSPVDLPLKSILRDFVYAC